MKQRLKEVIFQMVCIRMMIETYKFNFTAGYYGIARAEDGHRRALRPLMFEDRCMLVFFNMLLLFRILAVEQKFFCDRPTEKTITVTVCRGLKVI